MSDATACFCRNIVLIGLRGAGKTSVGRALAGRLRWRCVDTDQLVTSAAGATIRDIFEQRGEPTFRALERDAIAGAVSGAQQIISVGGGAVVLPENRERLKAAGLVVWLTADLDELHRRIDADPATAAARPGLTQYGSRDELEHLLAARGPLYAEIASITVDTTRQTVADVVDVIVARVQATPLAGPSL